MPVDTTTLFPQVNEHARLITAGQMPAAVAADWLMEQGCELSDVLLLFAGDSPDYQDGLHQAAIVEWLRATEPGRAHSVLVDPRAVGEHLGSVGVVKEITLRWQAVRAVSIEQYRIDQIIRDDNYMLGVRGQRRMGGIHAIATDVANRLDLTFNWDRLCQQCRAVLDYGPTVDPGLQIAAAVARARRWLKRQVLALFPEVVCKVERIVPNSDHMGTRIFLVEVAATDVIPLEDAEMRQAYRDMIGLPAQE